MTQDAIEYETNIAGLVERDAHYGKEYGLEIIGCGPVRWRAIPPRIFVTLA